VSYDLLIFIERFLKWAPQYNHGDMKT
jgi:hypothetical protein